MKEYPQWLGEKVFTNEKGYDWFIDKSMVDYAKVRKVHGYKFYIVGKDGKPLERVMLDRNNQPKYTTTSSEDMAVKIDIMKRLSLRK